MKEFLATAAGARGRAFVPIVLLLLLGLPIATWLDLRNLSQETLMRQAADVNALMTSVRGYYADNIVAHVLSTSGPAQVVDNYASVPGAIPIPATLSLELGRVITGQQGGITYRFVSDFPFKGHPAHRLDTFERNGLALLREHPDAHITEESGSLFASRVRLITPIVMSAPCVNCHNSHPDSPKRDWKVGDVRGIQEIIINGRAIANLFSFKYLFGYFLIASLVGIGFIVLQQKQATVIAGMNRDLGHANSHLRSISDKISRYLSPQIYQSIFSGERDVLIDTERKKLTIFFSDIKDFTAITESLQPEEITLLLNEYLTAMSDIALKHGGTVDKFIGDAILVFFGDPQTRGTSEDAKACLRMALEMQRRMRELDAKWRTDGFEEPFRVRMGINTGFCNVGNFGSTNRMDYTVIGAEANLAARLQSIANPGSIILSYETYALVRDLVVAHPLPPITMKGISRQIVPYAVDAIVDESGMRTRIFTEHLVGLDLYFDPAMVEPGSVNHVRGVLNDAITALDQCEPRDGRGKTKQAT